MTTNQLSECVAGMEPSRGQVQAGGLTFSYLEWGVGNLKYLRSHSYLNKLCQVSNGATLITDMTYGLEGSL